MVEPYLHFPICLHGIVLNYLSTRTTLPFLLFCSTRIVVIVVILLSAHSWSLLEKSPIVQPLKNKVHYLVHKSPPLVRILLSRVTVITVVMNFGFQVSDVCLLL
jgi:hypothetical protein